MNHRTFPLFLAMVLGAAPTLACVGDCDRDGQVLVDEVVLGVNLALGTEPTEACYAYDRNFDDSVTVDEILSAVNFALQGCPAPQTTAFVTATDFETGSFGTVDLQSREVILPAGSSRQINADAIARVDGDRLYVVNRFGLTGDSVQARDPQAGYSLLWDCSTGAGTNPHDIAFAAPDKAYVTLYDSTELLVIDPSVGPDCNGFVRETIDLSPYADSDGIPEMDAMQIVGDVLYVTLQRLDRDAFFSPNGKGMVVAIDTQTDSIARALGMSGENPFSRMILRDGLLWISSVGAFTERDGGIETIDVATNFTRGYAVTEADLGGDITDFVLVSDSIGFAVISKDDFSNALVEFSPATGSVTRTLIGGSTFIAQLQVTEDGDLYVADRSFSTPGLRIFDVRTGLERAESPLDLGLPPFDITFLR